MKSADPHQNAQVYALLDFFVGSLSSSELFVRGDFLRQKLAFLKNREKNKNIILARSAFALDYLIIDLFLYVLFFELSLLKRAHLKVIHHTYFGGKNENIYLFAQVVFLSNALSLPPVGLRLITLQNRIALLDKIDNKHNNKEKYEPLDTPISDAQMEVLLHLPLALAKRMSAVVVFAFVGAFFWWMNIEKQAIHSNIEPTSSSFIARGETTSEPVFFEVKKSTATPAPILASQKNSGATTATGEEQMMSSRTILSSA